MAIYKTFSSVKGDELEMILWPAEGQPKAIVQLVHGMCEHMRRYEATALQLNKAGYTVVGHTHLGHGEKTTHLGFFAREGGWDALIEDVHTVRGIMQKEYPDVPYYLLGHSMGSFVVRGYCLKYEKGLTGVILSGTGHYPKAIVTFAGAVSGLQCVLGMAEKPSKLVEALSSAGNNKGYDDVQTPFDWLSRDRASVQKYVDDPLCSFTFTAGAYRDMFDGLSRLYPEKLSPMEKEIPVLLFSGDMDPVGSHGTGVKKVAQEYADAGIRDITVKLYPQGRHEMFNELNKEEVWADLTAWLDSKLG